MTFKDFFDAIAKALGFGTLEGDIALICFTLLLSVASYIISQLWISHTNHKSARREYEYSRSQAVNSKRFDNELEATKDLSEIFMELRLLTHEMKYCPENKIDEVDAKWRTRYNEAALLVGRSAPILNIRDISDGAPTCGVHSLSHNSNNDKWIDIDAISASFEALSGNNKLSENESTECKPSLYLRAIQFLNMCIITRKMVLEQRGVEGCGSEPPLSLFVAEDEPYCLLSIDYDSVENLTSKVDNADETLAEAYKHFVNCAFCRLRNSDTGQRDARRINRHNARRRTIEKSFPALTKHDRTCPYPTKNESE